MPHESREFRPKIKVMIPNPSIIDGIKRNKISFMSSRESSWYNPIAAMLKIMTNVNVQASGNKDENEKGNGST
jgi:hypothetical protein